MLVTGRCVHDLDSLSFLFSRQVPVYYFYLSHTLNVYNNTAVFKTVSLSHAPMYNYDSVRGEKTSMPRKLTDCLHLFYYIHLNVCMPALGVITFNEYW